MIRLGDKFYKFNGDDLERIRVKRFKNVSTVIVERNNENITMDLKDIANVYTRIKPDGLIGFSILDLGTDVKDVAISLYRSHDIDHGTDNLPYAVCRQNIVNLHAEQLNTSQTSFIGMSISKDTVPEGVDFKMTLACNGVLDTTMVAVYLDDKFEDILGFIKTKKYDEVLSNLYNIVQHENSNVMGYCQTLKDLLIENEFMYDFRSAFKIIPVDFNVETMEEDELIPTQKQYLEDLLKIELFKTYVIKFSKEINLKEIKRDFILLSDANEDIYIIGFDQGKYINRYYRSYVKDKRDAIMMLKHVNNKK